MPYKITPILCGIRETDQGVMTYLKNYGKRIWLPMWAFLVQGEGRNILIDTGLDDFIVPEEFTKQTGLTAKYLDEALAEIGLSPDDITMVINTHLHDDHCANNPMFEKAKFFVQARELEFAKNPHPLDHRFEPAFFEDCNFELMDGDQEIVPGINVIFTPGHTPGSQSVLVDTEKGPVVITGFCCNMENFPSAGPAVTPGVHTDALAAYDSAQKIKALKAAIIPCHALEAAEMKF